MSEDRKNTYEGMFLFPQAATGNLQAAVDHVKDILARHDATIRSLSKWDERRLAYEIKGNKRGVYFLVHMDVPPESLSKIERDCNLSEQLLRVMITRANHLSDDAISAADRQQELADEIKLRGEQAAEAEKQASVAVAVAVSAPEPADEPVPSLTDEPEVPKPAEGGE